MEHLRLRTDVHGHVLACLKPQRSLLTLLGIALLLLNGLYNILELELAALYLLDSSKVLLALTGTDTRLSVHTQMNDSCSRLILIFHLF